MSLLSPDLENTPGSDAAVYGASRAYVAPGAIAAHQALASTTGTYAEPAQRFADATRQAGPYNGADGRVTPLAYMGAAAFENSGLAPSRGPYGTSGYQPGRGLEDEPVDAAERASQQTAQNAAGGEFAKIALEPELNNAASRIRSTVRP